MPIAPSLAKGLRAVAFVPVLCLLLVACGEDECSNNNDCPVGRICRLGLCALDPGGGDGTVDVLPDIPLDCLVAGPGDLVMTEICADPSGDLDGDGTASATRDEFVEVVNVAARPVALTNVQIEVGSKRVAIGSVCLNPYQARVLFGSGGLPGLTNSGGTVSLVVDGQVVQSHTYGAEGGKKSSLTLERQLDKTSPWVLHKDVAPTAYSPGTCFNGNEFPNCDGVGPNPDAEVIGDSEVSINCQAAGPDDLIMTEILADPGGVDVDGNGTASATGDEFVEVVNVATRPVALTNVQIDVKGKAVGLGTLCLDPNQARVLFGSGGLPGLTNSGSTVSLLVDGQVVQTHTYGSEGNDKTSLTLERQLDRTSAWVKHKSVASTPFSPGTCFNGNPFPDCSTVVVPTDVVDAADTSDVADITETVDDVGPTCGPLVAVGDVVINEVMANAGTVHDWNDDGTAHAEQDEYVEIVSTASGPVLLQGLKIADASTSSPDKYTFGAVCIEPGEAIVVFGVGAKHYTSSGVVQLDAATHGLSVNNSGDETMYLRFSASNVLDSFSFNISGSSSAQEAARGVARAKLPDITGAIGPHPELSTGRKGSPGLCNENGLPFPGCLTP